MKLSKKILLIGLLSVASLSLLIGRSEAKPEAALDSNSPGRFDVLVANGPTTAITDEASPYNGGYKCDMFDQRGKKVGIIEHSLPDPTPGAISLAKITLSDGSWLEGSGPAEVAASTEGNYLIALETTNIKTHGWFNGVKEVVVRSEVQPDSNGFPSFCRHCMDLFKR